MCAIILASLERADDSLTRGDVADHTTALASFVVEADEEIAALGPQRIFQLELGRSHK